MIGYFDNKISGALLVDEANNLIDQINRKLDEIYRFLDLKRYFLIIKSHTTTPDFEADLLARNIPEAAMRFKREFHSALIELNPKDLVDFITEGPI